LRTGNQVYVREKGYTMAQTTYVSGDVFRVERTGTTISYKKNGAVFYTSTVASSGSMLVDTTLYSEAATITGAKIFGGGI
jgi:hypothetical protein